MVEQNEHEASRAGIEFKQGSGEYGAPLADALEDEGAPQPGVMPGAEEAQLGQMRQGSVPLHPAMIQLPFSVMGRVLTELTSYPGFTFTEQELMWLAELWTQCGITMDPRIQAAVGTTSMIGGKAMGYFAWVKAGKPEIQYVATGGVVQKQEASSE